MDATTEQEAAGFAVPWAYRDGETVHLHEYDGKGGNLVCGECHEPVIYKRGVEGVRSHHFAHKSGNEGGCSLMTVTHRIFRDAAAELLVEAGGLPADLVDRMPFDADPWTLPGSVEIEKLVPGTIYRSDVLFVPASIAGRVLDLEIVVESPPSKAKRDAIIKAGHAIAVLSVNHDWNRFQGCRNEREKLELAKDYMRGKGLFKLLSLPPPKVVPSPARRVVRQGSGGFRCGDRFERPYRGYSEYRQTMPDRAPLTYQALARQFEEFNAPQRAGRQVVTARAETWAKICCPECQRERGRRPEPVARQGGQPEAWQCKKHNLKGVA